MKKLFLFLMFFSAVYSSARCVERTFSNGSAGICTIGGFNPISCSVTNTGDTDRYGCPGNLTAGCWSDLPYSSNCVATSTGCDWQSCAWRGSVMCCSSQCEADSVACVNAGNSWEYTQSATCGGMSCVEPIQCDTTMHCIEYPFNRCEDVQSNGSVYCDENGCSGLPYSRWFSEYRTECQNECGEHRTNSITGDTLISFNSTCDDTTQCSDETKCIDFPNSGTYALYKVCIVGNEQIGNAVTNKSYPQFIGGGAGSCASVNMNSTNINNPNNSGNANNNSFPNSFNQNEVTDNCLIYGIGCPENFNDTTNYNNNINRSPEHCICEPLDGSAFVSSIICPDGSRSTFYGSCSLWESVHSSSSVSNSSSSTNPPESSSIGSENPPASSGGISGDYPEWNIIKQNQKNANEVLGSMAQTLKSLSGSIVNGIKDFFNGYNYNDGDGQLDWNRVDSVVTLDTIIDTAGVLNAIFGRVDSTNRILDTLQHSSFTGCPCITFFNGNQTTDFSHGHLSFKEIKIELADLHGFNFCRIVSSIVVALASVVSFFIGFSIFKNISP